MGGVCHICLFIVKVYVYYPLVKTGRPLPLLTSPAPAIALSVGQMPLRSVLLRVRGRANLFFSCRSSVLGRFHRISLATHSRSLSCYLGQLFRPLPLICQVAKHCIVLGQGPQRCAVDKFIQSSMSCRDLVTTAIIRHSSKGKSISGGCNFCDVALPPKGIILSSSCINCRPYFIAFRLAYSAVVSLSLSPTKMLKRIIVGKVSPQSSILGDQMKISSIPTDQIGSLPTLLNRASIIGALRQLPNIAKKARNVDNLFIQKNSNSSGLFLLSKGPICRASRILNFFSTFGPSTIGGTAFCGKDFPTRCNKELSSIMSIHAGRKGQGRCRKGVSVNLLTTHTGLRKPVVGSQSSFGISMQHA